MSVVTVPNTNISFKDHLATVSKSAFYRTSTSGSGAITNISLGTLSTFDYHPDATDTSATGAVLGKSIGETLRRNTGAGDKVRKLIIQIGFNVNISYSGPTGTRCWKTPTLTTTSTWTVLPPLTWEGTDLSWLAFAGFNYDGGATLTLYGQVPYNSGYTVRWYDGATLLGTGTQIDLTSTKWTGSEVIYVTAS